jgi:acyl-coenzyme A thioesterase PaaI-like protein
MSEDAAKTLSAAEIQAIFDRSPFIGWLGLKVVSVDHERQEIAVRMEMRPELERRPGTRQFHGGPIAAVIDVVGDFAIGMLVGGGVPTMNFRTDYLRPSAAQSPPSHASVGPVKRPRLSTSKCSTMRRDWWRSAAARIRATRASPGVPMSTRASSSPGAC